MTKPSHTPDPPAAFRTTRSRTMTTSSSRTPAHRGVAVRESSFARLGLETRDVLVVMLGVLLVVAYGPFFW